MDEVGIMEGMGLNGLVVGHADRTSVYVKCPQSRNWTSMTECVSATGSHTNPLVIFKGANVQAQWIPEDLESQMTTWRLTTSDNGWTSNTLALKWLQGVFIPQTQPESSDEWRLLVLDGHGSHTTEDFMYTCFQNKVRLLFSPPHTSHILQPLDLGIFSSLKAAYRRHLYNYVALTDSSPLGQRNFLRCYVSARSDALTSRNIWSGWKATGLWPVNIEKPLNSRRMLPAPAGPSQQPELPVSQDPQHWTTPKRSADVMRLAREANIPQTADARRALRTIGRGFDRLLALYVEERDKRHALEQRQDNAQPQKRRRVVADPNTLFLTVADTRARQEAYSASNNIENDAAAIGEQDYEDMCFSFQI